MSATSPGPTPVVITPLVRTALDIAARIGAKPYEVRLINHATQLRFRNGALVNVFDTGSLVFQGPHHAVVPIRAAFDAAGPLKISKPRSVQKSTEPAAIPKQAVRTPSDVSALATGSGANEDSPPW